MQYFGKINEGGICHSGDSALQKSPESDSGLVPV
jgi:hypothetical protein